MLQIKSVVFNKGDYLYTIEYFDGKSVRKISTNEEALESLGLSVSVLANACKDYLEQAYRMNVKVNSVKFGKENSKTCAVQLTVQAGEKIFGIVTKIHPVASSENFPDKDQVRCNEALTELWGEVERYINGERAQKELPFEAPECEVEDAEDDNEMAG